MRKKKLPSRHQIDDKVILAGAIRDCRIWAVILTDSITGERYDVAVPSHRDSDKMEIIFGVPWTQVKGSTTRHCGDLLSSDIRLLKPC